MSTSTGSILKDTQELVLLVNEDCLYYLSHCFILLFDFKSWFGGTAC